MQHSKNQSTNEKIYFVLYRACRLLLAACDTFRPAAIEQLKVLGEGIEVPVYTEEGVKDPIRIARNAIAKAKAEGYS